jgi:endonuclease YncB( thermonuclease family)
MTLFLATAALICSTVTATPTYVVDGDTFSATMRIWPGLVASERVRVLGVDTPEVNKKATREAGLVSKAYAKAWLEKGDVELDVLCERDNLSRILAHVTRDGQNLATLLIEVGLGIPREK